MAIVNIRRASGSLVYDPPTIKLAASDFIVFANCDPEEPHQPTKLGQPANYWYDNQLPPFVEGQPAATSPAINLSSAGGTITYEDGLNPGSGITGTITF